MITCMGFFIGAKSNIGNQPVFKGDKKVDNLVLRR